MQLDSVKNLLILRMKNSDLLIIALIGSQVQKSHIIERVPLKSIAEDKLTQFAWITHFDSSYYIEGTEKGYLKIKDIDDVGSCLIAVPSHTVDQVQQIVYSQSKRLVLMTSRDGKL